MVEVVGKKLCSVLSAAIFIATLELATFNEETATEIKIISAEQVSTNNQQWARNAFDGNKTTFSLTDDMKSSECWIEFTLADRYNIAWIEIVNRHADRDNKTWCESNPETCISRLKYVEGIVYRDTSDERGSCGKIEDVKNGLDQENQTYRLYCNNSYGDKVRLTRTGKQGLEDNAINIAELSVFGHENRGAPRDVSENEVALTTGTMSGVFSEQGVEFVLDGNFTTFAHTTASNFSWIRVEFREVSPVFFVNIINRYADEWCRGDQQKCQIERLEGAEVWLEQGTEENVKCGVVTGVKASDILQDNIYRVDCNMMVGRAIQVILTGKMNLKLNIAEIYVYKSPGKNSLRII
ncbi:hypothetical protein ACHWQZ_G013282 [Mnemiopsis leidyi]